MIERDAKQPFRFSSSMELREVLGKRAMDEHRLLELIEEVPAPAASIYQKSIREGFGLTVAAALWKGKPVIGGETGSITVQLIQGVTGFSVNSQEAAAFYNRRLPNEPELMAALGQQRKEYVRHRFLITRHLQAYLGLLIYFQQRRRTG